MPSFSSQAPRPLGQAVSEFTAPPLPGPDTIAGRFVCLERLNAEAHASDLFAANQGDDHVWDYLNYGPFSRLQDYHEWQAQAAMSSDKVFYAFRDQARDGVLGIAAFLRINPADGVIEIGHIQMSPALQRSSAGSEGIMLMIAWAFNAAYRRVEWKCNALNAASRKAALRFGFTYEGLFRQHMINKGRNRDTAWFSIIDGEWPALRHAFETWLSPQNFDAAGRQKTSLSQLTSLALPGRI